MKKIVKVSAPGKLMLFGEHAVIYNRPCIVTAVDQRMNILVETTSNRNLEINGPDVGVTAYTKKIDDLGEGEDIPKGVRFVEFAVRNFYKKHKISSGLSVRTKSDFSAEFGFGSSSAVTVATLKALSEIFDTRITNQELFDLSYKTVLEIQGVGSGFDLAAAIWGGTVYFVTGGKEIVPIKTGDLPLVVGYTGIKADTPTLIRQVAILYGSHQQAVDTIFDAIAKVTKLARVSLGKSDFEEVGRLANINQGLLEALGVNTKKLSNLIFAAREAGAYGAKLSGAGGGDCMIAFVKNEERKEVEDVIAKAGGTVVKVKPNAEGIRVEKCK